MTAKKKRFIAKSIFMTHVRRIGLVRTALGGGLMYISVLEFIFLHLTTIVVLYQGLMAPFFPVKKFRIRDYILMDRTRIAGMRAFDKINCEFCGYANGSARLWNDQIDALAEADLGRGNLLIKLLAGVYSLGLAVFLVFIFLFSKVLFWVISLFLGLHWADTGAIGRQLRESGYGSRHGRVLGGLLRFAKLYARSLATNLEQIESGWCPLKHLETASTVVPEHHQNFFDRDKLVEAIEVLAQDGTVSPRKPKY